MPYTRAELLAAVRADHPEFAGVDDNKLFAAIAVDHPDLAKGISELQPKPGESGGPLPWYVGLFNQGNASSPTTQALDAGAAEARDQLRRVNEGIPQAITGLPGAATSAGSALWNALKGNLRPAGALAASATNPVVTPLKQAVELARPGAVNAPPPDSPASNAAAQGAGALLGGAVAAGAASEVMNGAQGAFQSMKARLAPVFTPTPGTPEVPVDAPQLNKWMGVAAKEVEHGANPGQQLLDDNLLGATKEATKANVDAALKVKGSQMQQMLTEASKPEFLYDKSLPVAQSSEGPFYEDSGHIVTFKGERVGTGPDNEPLIVPRQIVELPKSGVTIDAQTPVYDSAVQAVKRIGSPRDAAFQARIDGIVDDIESKYPGLDKLSPMDAHKLKVELGDAIDWHGEAYNDPINKVLVRIYGKLNQSIKDGVPGIADVQEDWGNLYSASKNLGKSMARDIVGSGSGPATPLPEPAVPPGPSPAGTLARFLAKRAVPYAIGGGALGLAARGMRDWFGPP